MAKYLFDWDSVGFALSFSDFNIGLSQPQSPGYIFFVAFGKMVNLIFNDPNFTMIVINILFSILTVIVIYFLAKQMFSRIFALIASLLLIFNPIFWFYGEIAAIYISTALFASLIAYTSYQVLRGNNRFLYISAIVLGLSGGFRQDIIIFMFLLWVFCLIYQCRDLKKLIKILIVLICSVALWFVPMIILSGGIENYYLASKELFSNAFSSNSIFYGADITQHLMMGIRVIFWSIMGIGTISILILLTYILFKLPSIKLSTFKNLKFIFVSLWIFPAFLFYLLIFYAKPGYLLVYLPTFALIMAFVILNFSSDLNKIFKRIPKSYFIVIFFSIVLVPGIMQFVNPSENGIYMTIQSADANYQNISDSIEEFSPSDTVIFTDNEVIWRKTRYYYPNFEIYSYYSYLSSGSEVKVLLHHKNGRTEQSETNIYEINLNSTTTKILWIVDSDSEFFESLQSKIEIKTIILPNGQKAYYSEINNQTHLEISDFIFKR